MSELSDYKRLVEKPRQDRDQATINSLRTELTATQEKLAAAEKYAMACDCDDIRRQLTTAQAQIDAARNEGLQMAVDDKIRAYRMFLADLQEQLTVVKLERPELSTVNRLRNHVLARIAAFNTQDKP